MFLCWDVSSIKKQQFWLFKLGSHLKLLEGTVAFFNGGGLFGLDNQETQGQEAWVPDIIHCASLDFLSCKMKA